MGMSPSGHDNPGVATIIFLLDDWLNALEEGTAALRWLDPAYRRPGARPPWTEAQLDELIRDLDGEVEREGQPGARHLRRSQGRAGILAAGDPTAPGPGPAAGAKPWSCMSPCCKRSGRRSNPEAERREWVSSS